MIDRIKLSLKFDAQKLKDDLALMEPSEWTNHFVKQNYEGSWTVIPLRAPAGETHPMKMIYSDPACKEFVDTRFLKRCSYFQKVLSTFRCTLNAARLMKLASGSIIKEHSDYTLSPEYGAIRLHIPITTNSDVEFYLNGKRVVMNEGECWYLRLSDPHWVANRGQTDRVHIVIDAKNNDWIQELLNDLKVDG
jgi:hypothetical protein